MKNIRFIILVFFICTLTNAQKQTKTIGDNDVLNALLSKRDSKTYIYNYFVPIKFMKPILSIDNFVDNLYGRCSSIENKNFKISEFIKLNKDRLLDEIDLSCYSKINEVDLHDNIKLTSNHSKKNILYFSKPIYIQDLIFIYYESKDESKLLLLNEQTLKIVCMKYLYLNIDN